MKLSSYTLAVVLIALRSVAADDSPKPPIVDLGYELHQAAILQDRSIYHFSNIRYAEPPVGELRFRAPLPPRGRSKAVNKGDVERICPQASPAWTLTAAKFVPGYLSRKFNLTAADLALSESAGGPPPPPDPRTSEDCLLLDVVVPSTVFNKAKAAGKADVPVLVWIHGGGYTTGSKNENGIYNPIGLFNASQSAGSDGFVFVAINYRLGAFGFLAGPDLQADGTANAGLHDQRLALQWIQQKIHLFGGNRKKVTVIGESAGGGSIMHQITAFGGLRGPAPFQQAILQSPAFQLVPSSFKQQQIFETYLSLLKVKSLAEARRLPSTALIEANAAAVGPATYGSSTFGPVVDGLFTPALPGRLLLQGSFDKNVNVMVGHNADEGLIYTDPSVQNDTAFRDFIAINLPSVSPSVIEYIDKTLYPEVFDGSYGYTDVVGRNDLVVSESIFTCNTNYLDRAFLNKTYAYLFSVPLGLHGQDVPYTFFTTPNPFVRSPSIALALQSYITSFVENGAPDGKGIPIFPLYGNDSKLVDLEISSITEIRDPTANERCLWWQKALFY